MDSTMPGSDGATVVTGSGTKNETAMSELCGRLLLLLRTTDSFLAFGVSLKYGLRNLHRACIRQPRGIIIASNNW